MSKSVWISGIAAMLLWAPWAEGQENKERSELRTGPVRIVVQAVAEPDKPINVQTDPIEETETFLTPAEEAHLMALHGLPIKLGEYWIGVSCRPAGDALRAQLRLPEGEGLVVDHVVEESPADKAGVKQHDVLLKAAETPLREHLADLVDAVEQTKESELALELIRGGKRKTIKVTPAKRPEDAAARQPWNVLPEGINREGIHRWIPRLELDEWKGPLEFRFIRPGALLPPAANVHPPLPGNLSIAITKQGDNPTKIVVTKDDQKWEVTEKNLKDLPDDVRPHVERLLGRVNFMAPLEKIRTFDFVPKVIRPDGAKPRIERRVLPHPVKPGEFHKEHQEQLEKRIEETNRQMEELRKSFDELRKNMPGTEAEKSNPTDL